MERLIGPSVRTPAGTGATGPGPRTLPQDLLHEASRRLGIVALLGAVLWFVSTVLEYLVIRSLAGRHPSWQELLAHDSIAAVSILVSLALYRFTRVSRREPRFMLDLGLVYLVFTALGIAILWHWQPLPGGWNVQPMFTWVGVVVLIFAAIIPNPPAKTAVVGFLAVSMNPVGMLLAKWRGAWDFGPVSNILVMHYPDYLLVGVAAVIGHVVTRMGQQVRRAREMGSYHVGELLGRGGMGEVYRATHRMLARPAAIKLIRPELLANGDPAQTQLAIRRFKREAEVAANLQSPHTVALYDFGVTDEQSLYFVMEMLDGLDLEQMVRKHGPLPPARVVHILCQVCNSLEEAHARGLVHRDVKPANIHVGRLGLQHDFVKVLDFGLVKQVEAGRREGTAATGDGMVPGTPDYMAPEMTLGREIDGRADIYALGCVGFFALTGRHVFEAANAFHMISRHLNDVPELPSRVASQPLPPELDQLILDCLAKDPGKRPQSAAELSRRLAAVPVEPWSEAQAREWWQAAGAATQVTGE